MNIKPEFINGTQIIRAEYEETLCGTDWIYH